jgi:hypothetical protein
MEIESGMPMTDFDLTTNMHDYLKFFDELKSMDFDVMVPGHHGAPATHEDVQVAKSYVTDVYNTVTRILAEDHQALKARAVQKYDRKMAGRSPAFSSTAKSTNARTKSKGHGSRNWRGSTFGRRATVAQRWFTLSGMWVLARPKVFDNKISYGKPSAARTYLGLKKEVTERASAPFALRIL